jgi:hypothetical protein
MPRIHSITPEELRQIEEMDAYPTSYPAIARIWIRKGIINRSEYVLLGAIQGYAHAESPPKGCFASNAVLAIDCGLQERQTKNMIYELMRRRIIRNWPSPQKRKGQEQRTIYVHWNCKPKKRKVADDD